MTVLQSKVSGPWNPTKVSTWRLRSQLNPANSALSTVYTKRLTNLEISSAHSNTVSSVTWLSGESGRGGKILCSSSRFFYWFQVPARSCSKTHVSFDEASIIRWVMIAYFLLQVQGKHKLISSSEIVNTYGQQMLILRKNNSLLGKKRFCFHAVTVETPTRTVNIPSLVTSVASFLVWITHLIITWVFFFASFPECDFKFRGRTIPGFRCQSDPWCIPIEHACNKLDNCPDRSDERTEYCNSKCQSQVPFLQCDPV